MYFRVESSSIEICNFILKYVCKLKYESVMYCISFESLTKSW